MDIKSIPQPYRVLARTMRPTTFAGLIGQETTVQILINGLKNTRLPHAFIFNGTHGIGKTTLARILAKALNCIGETPKITGEPCGNCLNCEAISEDRHIDVIEMDAASRTGIEDIREVIEVACYKPVTAPYKIYIIDEIHMLSKSAFNALLKTLEEPPAHVIFIFATTELRKVPKTILSRCMRFDLRSINLKTLENHFSKIAQEQGFEIEASALTLLARSAEGSVRDGLSLLEQAFTLSRGGEKEKEDSKVTYALICKMLGLSDRGKILTIFQALVQGQPLQAITLCREIFSYGADPLLFLNDLLDLTHALTTIKLNPHLITETGLFSEADHKDALALSENLSVPSLTRVWQILLKGINEAQMASRPSHACEMILLRLAYASTLPNVEDVIRLVQKTSSETKELISPSSSPLASAPTPHVNSNPKNFVELVELFAHYREPLLHAALKYDVSLIHFEPGILKIRLNTEVPKDFISKLTKLLKEWTGQYWDISLSHEEGHLSLIEQEHEQNKKYMEEVRQDPLISQILKTFPEAEITAIEPTQ